MFGLTETPFEHPKVEGSLFRFRPTLADLTADPVLVRVFHCNVDAAETSSRRVL